MRNENALLILLVTSHVHALHLQYTSYPLNRLTLRVFHPLPLQLITMPRNLHDEASLAYKSNRVVCAFLKGGVSSIWLSVSSRRNVADILEKMRNVTDLCGLQIPSTPGIKALQGNNRVCISKRYKYRPVYTQV